MLHEKMVRNEEIVGPTNRRFGVNFGRGLDFVGLTRALFGHGHAVWWLTAGLVLVFLAAVWPARLGPFNRLWLKFGRVAVQVRESRGHDAIVRFNNCSDWGGHAVIRQGSTPPKAECSRR